MTGRIILNFSDTAYVGVAYYGTGTQNTCSWLGGYIRQYELQNSNSIPVLSIQIYINTGVNDI